MGITKKKYVIILLMFALSALGVNYLSYDASGRAEDGSGAIKKIPHTIGAWRGEDFPLDSSVYEILETKAIIHRNYTFNDKKILLSVVYYPETKVDFHPPESCLGGKGIRTQSSVKRIQLDYNGDNINLGINTILREQGEDKQLVYYFYKAGPFVGNSYIKLRFSLAVNKFSSKEKSGALIRISTPVYSSDYKRAETALRDFMGELYPYIMEAL